MDDPGTVTVADLLRLVLLSEEPIDTPLTGKVHCQQGHAHPFRGRLRLEAMMLPPAESNGHHA